MVHSVYRKNTTELQALLTKLNLRVVLVDIQDAGTRLYTFIWALFSLMRAAGVCGAQGSRAWTEGSTAWFWTCTAR